MKFTGTVIFFYAFIVMLGGAIGYTLAGSTISLVMGFCFGILLMICGLGVAKEQKSALIASTFSTALLTLFFTYRYLTTGNTHPGLSMAILSAIVLLLIASTKRS